MDTPSSGSLALDADQRQLSELDTVCVPVVASTLEFELRRRTIKILTLVFFL